MTDLECRPPPSPIRDPSPFDRDAIINLDERNDRAHRVRATPSSLRPHKPCSPSEARQIGKLDIDLVVMPHRTTAPRARRSFSACADRDPQPVRPITHSVHVDVGQPDEEFTHARTIGLQQGLPG